MSQHTSLRSSSVGVKHRNVLKRYERIKTLVESEKWNDRKSVYNLPKQKLIKLKVKKTKDKAEEGAEGEAAATPTAGTASAASTAASKTAPSKGTSKK